ncbi:MAG: bifunctional phosphoglucose/phosphomannose isomerase [Chitinophagales bacterium]
MEQLIEEFTSQISEALEIGKKASFSETNKAFKNIVICGLGGSGIGGSLVQNLLSDKVSIPIIVSKTYTVPAFVNKDSLVIISSYSGNTEETLTCLKIANQLECKVVCVTSGGAIKEIAQKDGLDLIEIPGGMPPRACLAYSSVQLFYVLNAFGIIDNTFEKELSQTISNLDNNKAAIKTEAKELAKNLIGKTPIIYSADNFEAVAIRFRQQINENSKMLAWHHALPEMNHNELVGWRIKDNNQAVVYLRNETDLARIQTRMELNKKIISEYTPNIYEIWSKGSSSLERAFYTINLSDWVSLYLSNLRGVDTTEVNVIDFLKGELAKENNV